MKPTEDTKSADSRLVEMKTALATLVRLALSDLDLFIWRNYLAYAPLLLIHHPEVLREAKTMLCMVDRSVVFRSSSSLENYLHRIISAQNGLHPYDGDLTRLVTEKKLSDRLRFINNYAQEHGFQELLTPLMANSLINYPSQVAKVSVEFKSLATITRQFEQQDITAQHLRIKITLLTPVITQGSDEKKIDHSTGEDLSSSAPPLEDQKLYPAFFISQMFRPYIIPGLMQSFEFTRHFIYQMVHFINGQPRPSPHVQMVTVSAAYCSVRFLPGNNEYKLQPGSQNSSSSRSFGC